MFSTAAHLWCVHACAADASGHRSVKRPGNDGQRSSEAHHSKAGQTRAEEDRGQGTLRVGEKSCLRCPSVTDTWAAFSSGPGPRVPRATEDSPSQRAPTSKRCDAPETPQVKGV